MLPGFRFLFAAVALSLSLLVFGLGAAALLRAAHEEFASLPAQRATPEIRFAPQDDAGPPTLAMLRIDSVAETEKISGPVVTDEPVAAAGQPPAAGPAAALSDMPAKVDSAPGLNGASDNATPPAAQPGNGETPIPPVSAETAAVPAPGPQAGSVEPIPSVQDAAGTIEAGAAPPVAASASAPATDPTIAPLGEPPVTTEAAPPATKPAVLSRKPAAKKAARPRPKIQRQRTALRSRAAPVQAAPTNPFGGPSPFGD